MTIFDVYVNDQKLCRAGVGADGVLTAIVRWVRLTGIPAAKARRLRQPVEETAVDVGGLSGDVHQRWLEGRSLKAGDRVTIVIGESDAADAPAHRQAAQRGSTRGPDHEARARQTRGPRPTRLRSRRRK
jgi:hypothetical protein